MSRMGRFRQVVKDFVGEILVLFTTFVEGCQNIRLKRSRMKSSALTKTLQSAGRFSRADQGSATMRVLTICTWRFLAISLCIHCQMKPRDLPSRESCPSRRKIVHRAASEHVFCCHRVSSVHWHSSKRDYCISGYPIQQKKYPQSAT